MANQIAEVSSERIPVRGGPARLAGSDGNAFFLMGLFCGYARRQGWSPDAIDAVPRGARSADYAHRVATMVDHIEEPDAESDGGAWTTSEPERG